jgi:TonB-dependent receptor
VSWAQNGYIEGTVTEAENNNEPAFGAIVSVDSTRYGAPCDFDGKYRISIPAGTYAVSCKYTGYGPVTITQVVVAAGKTTPLDFHLTRASILMGDSTGFVTIYAERPKEAVAPMLEEIKEGNGAVVGTTANEIRKSTATDAGQVARRIPGVTLVDNRFIVIRGLSERYNAVLLNNVLAPSVESDVKAFSFNLIPAPMIERFMIFQSPAANLPGEFGGGVVRITTTDIPSQTSLNIGYATGFRSGTTFEPFSLNKGTSADLFGFGANSRALPAGFPTNVRSVISQPQAVMAAGRSLRNDWCYETKPAQLDQRFNATYSLRLSKEKFQFGNVTSLNYSNTNTHFTSNRLDYNAFNTTLMHSDTVFNYKDAVYVNSVRLAVVQNNAFRFGKAGQHKINIKNLANQMGDNETTLRTGRNIEEGNYREEYSYRYSQRFVYTGQLMGEHEFNNSRTKLEWTAAYSAARRNDPDWRRARYTKPLSAAPGDPFTVYIPFSAQPFYMGRLFIEMEEDIYAGSLAFEQQITVGKDSATKKEGYSFTIKAGGYYEQKERTYGVRNLGYKAASSQTFGNYELQLLPICDLFAEENINTTNGLAIDEDTKKADTYYASTAIQAGYVMGVFPFGSFKGKTDEEMHERVRVSLGARYEASVQKLNGNTQNGDTVVVDNPVARILPSVNVAYNLTDRMLVRAGYGKTLNRPEFREISPTYFYDFLFNSINVGNPDLRTASIDNYDIRWEFYPRPGENITLGAFYKQFIDPIEMYFIPGVGSGGTRSFTWGNAPKAVNWGLEMEIRKKLDSINVPVLRNLAVVANAAWINSTIILDSTSTSEQRPMMGQSPWIVNAGLYYQNDSIGLQVNAMYNVIGPRVVIVGVPGVPEVWEMPRHQIDFSVTKTLGKNKNIDVRLNITDALNQEFVLLQDANDDDKLNKSTDQVMQSYKRGTYFTLGFTVRLLEPKQH